MSTSVRTRESAHSPPAERMPLGPQSPTVGGRRWAVRGLRSGRDRRPADLRRGERWTGEEVSLAVPSSRVANSAVLAVRLDSFRDDQRAELGAQLDDARDELPSS